MTQEIRDVLAAINTTYQSYFTDEIEKAPESGLMDRLTQTFTSTQAVENYAWLTDLFAVRRFTGERESIGGFASTYSLRNEIYVGTKEISIVDLEDKVVAGRAEAIGRGLADAYKRRKSAEVFNLLSNGFTAPTASNGLSTIDGAALFSTAHPWWTLEQIKANGTETHRIDPSGTFSNRTTAVFSEDALWTAYESFMLMENHHGESANVMPNVLTVGPKLARAARQLLGASTIARETATPGVYVTEENETQNLFELVVEPRLGTSLKWFLFDTNSSTKPFIVQNRAEPVFQINGSETLSGTIPDIVFNAEKVQYGVRGRFGVGYGLPYHAYGSTAGE